MEFLEFLECIHYILVLRKSLGFLTELFLSLQVLLEVKVSQVPVDLHLIIELLYIELIGVIQIPEILSRNRTCFTPSGLKFPECRECCAEVILFFHQRFQLIYHSLFLLQVLLSFLVKFPVILSSFFLIPIIYSFESVFKCGKRIGENRRSLSFRRYLCFRLN